ncbi:hypothetical protein L2E82_49115 [Cichorium intybus]|uniref:Uncharacterized protein n=1 Tax=Cichorium intybus TaxID=13427 RepID=A0ACB8Z0L2_CICIN|nr:hypothetical protein L2E82_49115 [Cichorium intybus]
MVLFLSRHLPHMWYVARVFVTLPTFEIGRLLVAVRPEHVVGLSNSILSLSRVQLLFGDLLVALYHVAAMENVTKAYVNFPKGTIELPERYGENAMAPTGKSGDDDIIVEEYGMIEAAVVGPVLTSMDVVDLESFVLNSHYLYHRCRYYTSDE